MSSIIVNLLDIFMNFVVFAIYIYIFIFIYNLFTSNTRITLWHNEKLLYNFD